MRTQRILILTALIATGLLIVGAANAQDGPKVGDPLPPPKNGDGTGGKDAQHADQTPGRITAKLGTLTACFSADHPPSPEYMAEIFERVRQYNGDDDVLQYNLDSRWSGTQGNPISLTWSFVPDGLNIDNGIGEGDADSELFKRMDSLFSNNGGREQWISEFEQVFARWGELTGVTYTRVTFDGEEWDDGAAWGSSGSSGRRGDIRISMKPIDGVNGVLAYNFFPSNGDMVMDRAEAWDTTSNDFRFFRNTVQHESGHGLGVRHVCSDNTSQLMEPLLNTNIDGPQHDDIRAVHRHYGDIFESDNSSGAATDIGTLSVGAEIKLGDVPPPSVSHGATLSIDANSERDWFRFTIDEALSASFTLTPIGRTYDDNSQRGDGSCNAGSDTDSLKVANLAMKIFASNGTTVLATAESEASGVVEEISDLALDAPGNYFVQVYETDAPSESQLYKLVLSAACSAPQITQQPQNQTACVGQSATFSVTATGGDLAFQWRKNGTNISGATESSYTINSVQSGDAANYDVRITNDCGNVTSNTAALTVNNPVSISNHPASQTVCEGSNVTFTVTASGSGTLTYQWRKNTNNINGATSSSYSINNVGTGDAASYDVVVTNSCGSVTSNAATLTVNSKPSISDQPDSQTVCEGGNVTFTVGASGSGTLTYQWRRNTNNIDGATSSSYSINNVQTGDAADYDVVVTNSCGSVTSNSATLTINSKPSISDHPDSQSVCEGGNVTFIVGASGSGTLTYQWRRNTNNIDGATSSSYSINNVQTGDAADYDVVVTNSCGSVTSNSAVLTVGEALSIVEQPADQAACTGGSATFSVAADGAGPITYQWRKDTQDINSATNASLTINPVSESDAGSYDVVVSSPCGQEISTAADLTVAAGPQITDQPDSQSVCVGDPASFSVTVEGDSLSYQWRKNTINIDGETQPSFAIDSAQSDDAGGYDVMITSACGNITSATATLTVGSGPQITDQPDSQSVGLGDAVTFTVVANGDGLTYQWRKDGGNINGATQSSHTIDPVTEDDAGAYDVVVGNDCGQSTSSAATLTIESGPTITDQPDSLLVCEGQSALFEVVAEGAPPLTYQWRKDGVEISGATDSTFEITATIQDDAAGYDVVVTNDFGNATSATAALDLNLRGDSNCDGSIDFDDIDCFVAALLSESSWDSCGRGGGCDFLCANDIDRNGSVDFDDIDSFVACLANGECP